MDPVREGEVVVNDAPPSIVLGGVVCLYLARASGFNRRKQDRVVPPVTCGTVLEQVRVATTVSSSHTVRVHTSLISTILVSV